MPEKEYIEREAAMAETRKPRLTDAELRRRLANIPAADVRPVVLCKDCMYCQKDKLGRWCFNDYENELRDEDFCSHGKRKESKT